MVNCRRESLDACPGVVTKVSQLDEYDILVVNKFVIGLPAVVKHTVRQFHKLLMTRSRPPLSSKMSWTGLKHI
jgi:hypothetical protein